MKYVMILKICSILAGTCEPFATVDKTFDSWSKCVGHGGELIVSFAKEMEEYVDNNKMYVTYICMEKKKENA